MTNYNQTPRRSRRLRKMDPPQDSDLHTPKRTKQRGIDRFVATPTDNNAFVNIAPIEEVEGEESDEEEIDCFCLPFRALFAWRGRSEMPRGGQ